MEGRLQSEAEDEYAAPAEAEACEASTKAEAIPSVRVVPEQHRIPLVRRQSRPGCECFETGAGHCLIWPHLASSASIIRLLRSEWTLRPWDRVLVNDQIPV